MFHKITGTYKFIGQGADGSRYGQHCVICGQKMSVQLLTTGSIDASGKQALACIKHLQDKLAWMIAWAKFEQAQHWPEVLTHSKPASKSHKIAETSILYLEDRKPRTGTELAEDIAIHLYARKRLGVAIILAAQPFPLAKATHEAWLKLANALQQGCRQTNNTQDIEVFNEHIQQIRSLRFTAQSLEESPRAKVFFMRPEELRQLPSNCQSVYVTAELSTEFRERLLNSLSDGSVVVNYAGNFNQKLMVGPAGFEPATNRL